FGSKGAEMELTLLMVVGRLDEALQMLREKESDPNRPDWPAVPVALKRMDGRAYHWLRAEAEAAAGNYDEAGEMMDNLIAALERRGAADVIETVRRYAFSGMGPSVLLQWMLEAPNNLRTLGEYYVIRGTLALEAGDNATALKNFRKAAMLGRDPGGAADIAAAGPSDFAFESRPIAVRYLRELE